ncbi:MAG: ABC transporter substrate-binding protein [Chloroflexi bacterium]|nr:MAG: ABC transporter substrate-binding protein [Chloroflexota bacterium]
MEESNYWTRLNRKRISRRALLSAGATTALGAAAAAVVGCGGGGNGNGNGGSSSDNGPGETSAPQVYGPPVPGGTIIQGRLLNVLGIDPHIDLTGLDIDMRLYSYLYSWKPFDEKAIFNNYALSVEMPSPDQTEFIFSLRPGVKIQPQDDNPAKGEVLTSTDVKESWVRRGTAITAPDKRFPLRISGTASPDANALRAALQTPDANTFSFKMSSPFVPAFREMSNPTWAIVPAKVIEKYGSSFTYGGLGQKAWGSGPYMLDEFRGTERIILQKHPEYFLSPRPWVDEIRYIIITEPQSLLAAFDSGQHDINGALMNKAQAEERMKKKDLIVVKAPTRFYPVIHFKIRPPFDDIRVREALDLGIDRDEIIDLIWDGEGNYNGPVQWLLARFSLPQDELRAAMPYDPQKARQLLSAAGYDNGIEAKMKIPRVPGAPFIADLSSLLKDQLGKVGIKLLLDEVELGTFIANVILPGNFDLAFFPNLPYDEPDRPLSFYHTRGVTGVGNWNNYTNPAIDALIDAQSVDFNEESRIKTILDVQRMILKEHGPQITMPGGNFYAARHSYVHLPYEFGVDPGEGALKDNEIGPEAADIYTTGKT